MSVPFIILAAAVIFFVWRSYKKKNQSGEAAQPPPENGTTVTGPDGQSYVVPNKLRKAYKNYESSPMESVYGLLCARQTADLGYAAFKRDRANLPADANTPYMDADLFFDACHFTAMAYQMGYDGVYPRDAAKSVYYYEILLEVCMDVVNRDRFKVDDLHIIYDCWEELAYAYSGGEGCAVDVEKAQDYYRNAFLAAQKKNDVNKQMNIIHTMLGGWPRPTKEYATLAVLFAKDMVQNSLVEGAALMEEFLYGIRKIGEEELGLDPQKDAALYYKAAGEEGSVYACYMLGNCYLKGIGTQVNREEGLRLIRAAAENGSLSAALQLAVIDREHEEQWLNAAEQIRRDLRSHLAVMQGVTGIHAETKPPRVNVELQNPDDGPEDDEDESSGYDEAEEAREPGFSDTTYDLSRIPSIVYDSGNNRWQRRGIYGDHAEYYNDNGNTVTIWNAEISGSSANTSAGTLHWY